VSHLEDFLALLPPEEKEQAKQKARTRAAGISNLLNALELLIFLERTAEAGKLCYTRPGRP
jgi:hypothetical protein